jgi:hypothetical protein
VTIQGANLCGGVNGQRQRLHGRKPIKNPRGF